MPEYGPANSRVEPGIRVSPQQGRGGGVFKTGIRLKPGIWVGEDGGGSKIFYLRIKELFFFPCPCLTPIVSDIQYDLNEEKCKKWRKTCGESALSRRASPTMHAPAPARGPTT